MSERSYLYGKAVPKLYAPAPEAPVAQIMAYATLTALGLAATATGADLGEAYCEYAGAAHTEGSQ